MKKLFAAIMIICMVMLTACGGNGESAEETKEEAREENVIQTVTFGTYNDEPIVWRILQDYGDGTCLLISEYALTQKQYNSQNTGILWENCTLRKWLNNDFIEEVFTEEEQERLVKVTNPNVNHPAVGTDNGNDTEDVAWLPDIEEVRTYFPDEASRICYNSAEGEAVSWWLRTVRFNYGVGNYGIGEGVSTEGSIGSVIATVNAEQYVRPMIRAAVAETVSSTEVEETVSSDAAPADNDNMHQTDLSENTEDGSDEYAVGDLVTIGEYADQPIEWRILERYDDGSYLLLSEYGIAAKSFNESSNAASWAESDLRSWLNNFFLNEAFSEEERSKLQGITNTNPENRYTGISGCEDTEDTVWLLSLDEVGKYLGTEAYSASENLMCLLTDKAQKDIIGYNTSEHRYNNLTVPQGTGSWWLRSSGGSEYNAAVIDNDGYCDPYGQSHQQSFAVRPVIRSFLPNTRTEGGETDTESIDIRTEAPYAAGDHVLFGTYEGNPIQWRILQDYGDGTYLLLSDQGIHAMPYNNTDGDTTWETSSIRAWLNGDFLTSAFSEDESSRLITVLKKNSGNAGTFTATEDSPDTEDTVWLLSIQDIGTYFGITAATAQPQEDLLCVVDEETASQVGEDEYHLYNLCCSEEYTDNGTFAIPVGSCAWWLRSLGYGTSSAVFIDSYGNLVSSGLTATIPLLVRPVVRAALSDDADLDALVSLQDTYTSGDSLEFGMYNNQPIKWRIIKCCDDGSYLMISCDTIDEMAYNSYENNAAWEDCSLRNWLNEDFLTSSFTESERSRMLPAEDVQDGETGDIVRIPDTDEINQYTDLILLDLSEYSSYWWAYYPSGNRGILVISSIPVIYQKHITLMDTSESIEYGVRPIIRIQP